MLNAVFVDLAHDMAGICGGNVDICDLFERSEKGVGIDFAHEVACLSVQQIDAAIVEPEPCCDGLGKRCRLAVRLGRLPSFRR